MDFIEVEVLNWEKYNPRKDVQRNSWFRFEHDVTTDDRFYHFTHEELWSYVHVLSTCSKHRASRVRINLDHVLRAARISPRALISALDKLEELEILTADVTDALRGRYADVTLRNETIRNVTERNEETNTSYNDTTLAQSDMFPVEQKPRKVQRLTAADQDLNREIWQAYSDAYERRYKVKPVRNATVNAKISQLRARLGAEAVGVVTFYLSSSNAFYARSLHAIGLCLKDAESLRTQWVKGRAVTEADVRNLEKSNRMQNTIERIEEGI